MKLAISATGSSLDALMDQRFGRAAYFLMVETESLEFEAIENSGAAAGGAGIQAAQKVIDAGAQVVLTGNVGPNAMQVLQAAGIKIYTSEPVEVRQLVEVYQQGGLSEITTPVAAHSGMKSGNA